MTDASSKIDVGMLKVGDVGLLIQILVGLHCALVGIILCSVFSVGGDQCPSNPATASS